MKHLIFTITLFIMSTLSVFSVTYTSIAAGTWDKVMPTTILSGDILNVSHTGMTAQVPHFFGNGGGQINVTGGDLTLNPVTGSFFQLTVNVSGGGTLSLGTGSLSISQGTWNVVGGHLDFSGITGSMTFNPTSATGSPASVTVPTVMPIATVSHTNINGNLGNSWAKFIADWSPTPLPIELLSFSAKYDKNTKFVNINWSTATETDNHYFEIQRRGESGEYYSIITLNGAGTSLTQLDYQVTDESPTDGANYYRLVQYDYDGSSSESHIIAVETSPLDVNIYPIPAVSQLYVEHSGDKSQVDFYLFNDIGLSVLVKENTESAFVLPLEEYNQGVYYAEFLIDDKVVREKIVIVK